MWAKFVIRKAIGAGTLEQVEDFIPPLLDWLEEEGNRFIIRSALNLLTAILEVSRKLMYFLCVWSPTATAVEPRGGFVVEGSAAPTLHALEIS